MNLEAEARLHYARERMREIEELRAETAAALETATGADAAYLRSRAARLRRAAFLAWIAAAPLVTAAERTRPAKEFLRAS